MTEPALFELLTLDCRVDEYGTVCYCNTLGKLHRVHGPAVIYSDGGRAWCQNGLLHRLDGPVIVWADGRRDWYINGKELAQAEWLRQVASMETV